MVHSKITYDIQFLLLGLLSRTRLNLCTIFLGLFVLTIEQQFIGIASESVSFKERITFNILLK